MGRPGRKHERLAAAAREAGRGLSIAGWSEDGGIPPGFDAARPEESYARLVPLEHRRRLGQFFTPREVSDWMADWACGAGPRTVLDAGVGTGALIGEVLRRRPEAEATGIDPDVAVLAAARRGFLEDRLVVRLVRADFLAWDDDSTFDAVVSNRGGLLKFEPRDLLEIRVPDLRALSDSRLTRLAAATRRVDGAIRAQSSDRRSPEWIELDREVEAAIAEAARVSPPGSSGTGLVQGSLFPRPA